MDRCLDPSVLHIHCNLATACSKLLSILVILTTICISCNRKFLWDDFSVASRYLSKDHWLDLYYYTLLQQHFPILTEYFHLLQQIAYNTYTKCTFSQRTFRYKFVKNTKLYFVFFIKIKTFYLEENSLKRGKYFCFCINTSPSEYSVSCLRSLIAPSNLRNKKNRIK